MKSLEHALNALGRAGIVIRNIEMAILKLKDSELSVDEQLVNLFNQGRSIGVLFYKDAHFNESNLIETLNELEIEYRTRQVILGNLLDKPHPELVNQENF